MTNTKLQKRALVLSIISMAICVTMLIGSTYAWFTDTASNTGNRIVSGILKIDLLKYTGDRTTDDGYSSIKNGTGSIFEGYERAQNSTSTLWEPGKTQIVYLAVRNLGNLAVKYNVWLNVTETTSADSVTADKEVNLYDAFEYALIRDVDYDGAQSAIAGNGIVTWNGVLQLADETGGVPAGTNRIGTTGILDGIVNGVKNETDYFALAIHMNEDAGNDYQDREFTFDVNVVASQLNREEDSFGPDYDKNASDWYKLNYGSDVSGFEFSVDGAEIPSGSPVLSGSVVRVELSNCAAALNCFGVTSDSGNVQIYSDAGCTVPARVSSSGTYYFRMPDSDVTVTAVNNELCVAQGTLITLADGTEKPVEETAAGDKVLAWDFMNGTYAESEVAVLVDHGTETYTVIDLVFDDGTTLGVIGEHGIFDFDLNKFVYIDGENYGEFIGHGFVKYAENGYDVVTLTEAYVTEEVTNAYSIISAGTMNVFASGILTVAPPEEVFNWMPMGETLKYDVTLLDEQIAEYGLYDYSVFADFATEAQFEAFNGAYFRIPVERGDFSFEYLVQLFGAYADFMQ